MEGAEPSLPLLVVGANLLDVMLATADQKVDSFKQHLLELHQGTHSFQSAKYCSLASVFRILDILVLPTNRSGDATKIIFFVYYSLKLHLHHSTKIKSRKEVTKEQKSRFSYYFCLMMEGSGFVPLPNRSGSGRSKILKIRTQIQNTDLHCVIMLSIMMLACVTSSYSLVLFLIRVPCINEFTVYKGL